MELSYQWNAVSWRPYIGHMSYAARMADHKPPRLDGGERETLLALLGYQRESLIRKVTDVDDASARLSPVDSGTSLLWLILHLTRAEVTWVQSRFAGLDVEIPEDVATADDTLAEAICRYREVSQSTDDIILDASDLDELCRRSDAPDPVNLRWVLMHLLEETARHTGHADILRELFDGHTGR
jgi:uncharacterized damage-inducible protein DinB